MDQTYTFQPTASSSNDNGLTFSISSKPSWASFDKSNGRLKGKPKKDDVGTYDGITISVSDGDSSTSLDPFSVDVVDHGAESLTLSWLPPTENVDGSPLTDLAGFRIHYGTDSRNYETVIDVNNAGLTMYVVDGLVPSMYHFVITAYDMDGLESDYSDEAVVSLGEI